MPEIKEKKKGGFIKHFLVIGSGTAINMFLGLFTTPIITRMVDPVKYGQLSIFLMYVQIAVMVLCMGLDQTLVRFYYEDDRIEYKRKLLGQCIFLPVTVCIVASVAVIVLTLTGVLKLEFESRITIWLCVCTLVHLLYRFSQLIVRLSYHSKTYSLLNIINKMVYAIMAISLLMVMKEENELDALVMATTIAFTVCLVWSVISERKIWKLHDTKDIRLTSSKTELYRYGLPFILSMGITTVFQALDKMSLNHFCTYAEVGVYSSTMSLVHIFAIIQTTFNVLWSPLATEHYTKDKTDTVFYQVANQVITVIMFFLGLSLILCKDLFAVLLGEKYRAAAYTLPFLIFHPIMYTISESSCMGIAFAKKTKANVVVAGIACIVNLIGNTILVPVLAGKGAAISTGVSYIVFMVVRTMISNKYFKVDYKMGKFAVITTLTFMYALYNTFIPFGIIAVIGYSVCVAVMVLLYKETIIWMIKYVKANGLKALKRKKKTS